MQTDLDNIRKMCTEYITEPKLLVVPNMSVKGQLQKTLSDEGIFFANLSMKTIDELAYESVASEVFASKFTVIDKTGMEDAIHDVLTELKKELKYFNAVEVTGGLNKTVASTVLELKKAGLNFGKIKFNLVKNSDKKQDLIKITEAYKEYLGKKKCLDFADVIELAIKRSKDTKLNFSAIYVIETCKLSFIDKELLKCLNYEVKDEDDSKYLDYKEASKNINNIEFKKTYGDNAEAKEVLRTIINNKIPFDKVLIVGLNPEPYTQLIYQQLLQYIYNNPELKKNYELPITFGTGISIAISTPFKFVTALLKWVSNGYDVHDFINLIATRAIKLKQDADNSVSRTTLINALKKSELKWQRGTYINTLKKYLEELRAKGNENRVNAIEYVIKLLDEVLFPNIPETDENGMVSVDDTVTGLKIIMKSCCKINSSLDSEGYDDIFKEADKIIKGRKVVLAELADTITEHISEVRIFSSNPEAGKMHFTTFHGAEWVKRDYTFLIGTDVLRFPSNINQNPILLDAEREEGLIKSPEILEGNIKDMSRFLESITGKLYVSYAYFDTIQNRENYPSLIYNTLIENMAEKSNMTEYEFTEKKVKTVNFTLSDIKESIDEDDYILTKATDSRLLKNFGREEISSGFLSFDVENSKFEFSPSSLTTYLNCKYKYYLKYILRLQAISNKELDRLGWLSYFEIGKLYHKIFEKFEDRVIEDKKVLDSEDTAVFEIEKIYTEVLGEYEKELPTASEYHTDKEKDDIKKNCIRFAKEEFYCKDESIPLLTEYRFGDDKSCVIKAKGEKIYITGVIDRVDFIKSKNMVKIIDYKTGSTYGYDILNDVKEDILNEKSVQPILYYLALKKLAKDDDGTKIFKNISSAEYYFVTAKGNYEKFEIDFSKESEEEITEELGELVAQIKSGEFFISERKNCKYCEYADSCKYKDGDIN